jgi:hypothetical protein
MGLDTHKCLTELDEDGGVEDIIGVEKDVLDLVELEQPAEVI